MISINDVVRLKNNSSLCEIFPRDERFLVLNIVDTERFGYVAEIQCSGGNEIVNAGIYNFRSVYE